MKEAKFCPNCGSENSIVFVEKEKSIDIKGVPIPVKYKVKHCTNCQIDFKSLSETFDVINQARQQYRIMFNIPFPEELQDFKDKYHFSLRDMEKLTGIAFKTIERYLKGAIPDPSNIKFFKVLLNNPETVLFLMNDDPYFKARKFNATRELLEKEIKEKHRQDCTVCRIVFESTTRSWVIKSHFSNVYRKIDLLKKSIDAFEKIKFFIKRDVEKKEQVPLYSLNLMPSLPVRGDTRYQLYFNKVRIEKEEQNEQEDQFSYAG